MTIFIEPEKVPEKYKLSQNEYERLIHTETEEMQKNILEEFSKTLPNMNRTTNGCVRWCSKCKHVKPDRAHHCSVCEDCILKMDHHCPWVNNCISFTNYKSFLLFLFYSLLYCTFISATTFQYFMFLWNRDTNGANRFHLLFLFFISVMFAISLLSLFCYHVHLISHNRTTLEAFRAPIFRKGPDKNGFNVGALNNFKEVFGDNKILWFFPVFTSRGDGCGFPTKKQNEEHDHLLIV